MRSGKSAGLDGITVEFLKNRGNQGTVAQKIIKFKWLSSERLNSILYMTYLQRNRGRGKLKGVNLRSIPGKVYCRIIIRSGSGMKQ